MDTFFARLRVALFMLALLFACGCGQSDRMVNSFDGTISKGGSGEGVAFDPGKYYFPSSCSNTLGRIASSVPIKISKITVSHLQGSANFVVEKDATIEGLDAARSLDKVLGEIGPIPAGTYGYIILQVAGASLKLRPYLGGDVIDVHSASGELKIKLSPEYLITQNGKRPRIIFDLCRNLVLTGNEGRNEDDCDEDSGTRSEDYRRPRGVTLTPSVRAQVLY